MKDSEKENTVNMKGAFILKYRTKAIPEEKVVLVKRYLVGEISATKACKIVGADKKSFGG